MARAWRGGMTPPNVPISTHEGQRAGRHVRRHGISLGRWSSTATPKTFGTCWGERVFCPVRVNGHPAEVTDLPCSNA